MTTPVNNQTPQPKASFVKRAACAAGRGVVKIADFTGTVTLTATSLIVGGGLGIGIVNLGEKAIQNRKNIIAYIPSSVIARLPQSLQPSAPEITQTEPVVTEPVVSDSTIKLQPPVNDLETPPVIEQPTTTTIEPKKAEEQAKITPAANGNMIKTLHKAVRVTIGVIVLGVATKMAYTHYQSTRTPEEYPSPYVYESPVEEISAESHQERLPEQRKGATLEAKASSQGIELLPQETIVVPTKPELSIPLSGPVVVPAKAEIALPPAPQPLILPTNKEGIAVLGMSGSQALDLVRSGKPLPKGLTLQQFGIPEGAVGRRFARGIIRRK